MKHKYFFNPGKYIRILDTPEARYQLMRMTSSAEPGKVYRIAQVDNVDNTLCLAGADWVSMSTVVQLLPITSVTLPN